MLLCIHLHTFLWANGFRHTFIGTTFRERRPGLRGPGDTRDLPRILGQSSPPKCQQCLQCPTVLSFLHALVQARTFNIPPRQHEGLTNITYLNGGLGQLLDL